MAEPFQRQQTRQLSDDDWHPVLPTGDVATLYLHDYEYSQRTRRHQEWVIGCCVRSYRLWLVSASMSADAFLRFPIDLTYMYLGLFHAGFSRHPPTIEIMMMYHLGTHSVYAVIKTHWLRLVQRRWKAVWRARQDVWCQRRHPDALKYRQCRGTYPTHLALPPWRGMLAGLRRPTRLGARLDNSNRMVPQV